MGNVDNRAVGCCAVETDALLNDVWVAGSQPWGLHKNQVLDLGVISTNYIMQKKKKL